MNKEGIISIYQELLACVEDIKAKSKGSTLTVGLKLQLKQLEDIIADLRKKARDGGFENEMVANDSVKIYSADDLFQLIDTSICSFDLREELKKVVGKKYVDDQLSRKKLWDVLQILDKYYQANVLNISAVTIDGRMKGEWKKIFGHHVFDLKLLAIAYQNSAKEALFIEISKLSPNKWISTPNSIDSAFQKCFKDKKSWLEEADLVDKAKVQLKIDGHEFSIIPASFDAGYFKFTNGKIQLSGKLALTSPVLISNQEAVLGGLLNDFEQGIRNTVTLKNFAGTVPDFSASTTIFTKGHSLSFGGFLVFTIKTDLAKFGVSTNKDEMEKLSFHELVDKTSAKFTGASMRLQGTFNVAQFFKEMGLKNTILNDSKCDVAVSGGFDISLNWDKIKKVKAQAKAKKDGVKTKQKNPDIDKPSLEKDKKVFKQIQDQNEDLAKKASKVGDAIDKKDKEALKKAAEELKDSANKAHDLLEKHKWQDKGLKNKAKELLDKTGQKIYNKIAGPIAKLTKVAKYAKPLAKLIPAVNAVLTVVEVATYIVDFVNWINSVDANHWEDYFIAIGESLENTNFGRWFSDFDQWMKSMK